MSPPAAQSPTTSSPVDEKAQFINGDKLFKTSEPENLNPQHDILTLPNQLATTGRARNALTLSRPHLSVSGILTPEASRPSSPYTPPVNYDGLSWPSRLYPNSMTHEKAILKTQFPGVGTKERLEATPEAAAARLEKLSGAIRTILECIGEDPDREGLVDTPSRYAKAMLYFTKGYEENLRVIVNNAVFQEDHDEMVIVKDIEVFSMCEHHLVPFTGRIHIGYIPKGKVLGLSKFARIAEMFARRLQLQERLTRQVAMAIEAILKPLGVAVVMESSHLCMVMRGVEKTTATTITSSMLGAFRKSTKTREEFMHLVLRNNR